MFGLRRTCQSPDKAQAVFVFCLLWLTVMPAAAQKAAPAPSKDEWTHRYVMANGLRLHYVTQGTGPMIVFLHGFPEFWYSWKNQLQEFGRTNEAVALDLPGYDLSDKPAKVADYAMPALVADLKAFLGAVAPGRKVTLVGDDWGGAVAWAYAAYCPETLDKVVVIAAPHPALFLRELQTDPAQMAASAMMYRVRDRRAEALLRHNRFTGLSDYLFKTAADPDSYTEADRRAYREAWSQPGALTGALNYYRAAEIGAAAPKKAKRAAQTPAVTLPTITVPTLVLWGDRDPGLMPANLDGLEALVTHLTVKRFPNGGHWLAHDQPDAVNAAIRAFLASSP